MKASKTCRPLQILRRLAPWAALLVLFAGLAAVRGLADSFTIDYDIMNGDFQNYNPVRHLLAGQAPYADFTVYLGAGELYGVAAVLLVIGNNFANSMFAAEFLTWFCFELLVLAACRALFVTGRGARAASAAVSAVCFLAVQGAAFPGASWLSGLLGYAASSGNSARMIRSGALSAAVLAIGALLAFWRRHPAQACAGGLRRLLPPGPALAVPFAAGALFVWSNDMGAAMYISVALAYGLFLLRRYRTDIKTIALRVAQYVLVSGVGLGVSVTLVSWGHPFAWLRQTRGASAYQAWYYGSEPESKLYYLSQLELDWSFWVMLALAVLAAVWLFAAKRDEDAVRAGGLFALTLGMALWNLLYCLLSSARNGPDGGARALLAALVPAALLAGIGRLANHWQALAQRLPRLLPGALAGVLGAAVFAWGLAGQLQARQAGRGEGYTNVPALGGWLGDQAARLETEQTVLAGRRVWSTYASALEAMTGQLQPSGTDYIIHVLGDRQRVDYLQQFQAAADFDLAQTPSYKVSSFERWSRNANWWFYRELYRYWQPVGTTYACGGMHIFWQKNGVDNDQNEPCTVTLEQLAPNAVTVTVTTADPSYKGVADVTLDYDFAVAGDFLLRGGVGSFLHVSADTEKRLCEAAGREGTYCDWFLPTDRGTYDIPVTIENGTGSVTLTALPGDAATLAVNSAVVNGTFFDWEYFYE